MSRPHGPDALSRYPKGFAQGDVVVGNLRFFAANPNTPQERQGRIVKPTRNKLAVRVLWDGCKGHQEADIRTITVLAQARYLPEAAE